MLLPFLMDSADEDASSTLRPKTETLAYSLARQQENLNMVKRDKWTEADVLALAAEEPDKFERKAGQLYTSGIDKFQNTPAKTLSAFANSGGGSIILGANDKSW